MLTMWLEISLLQLSVMPQIFMLNLEGTDLYTNCIFLWPEFFGVGRDFKISTK